MSTFDYAELASLAIELLTEFGQTMQLRRVTGATYNPVTGANTVAGSTTNTPVLAVQTEFTKTWRETRQVEANDRLYILDGTVEPLMNDKLVLPGGEVWNLQAVEPIRPAELAIIYLVQVRK